MDQREQVRAEIDRSTVELTSKLKELDHRARALRDRVVRSIDLEHQVQQRPWAVFGASVGAGYLLGLLLP
ncbi:MAG TPA: hypothetical protein VML75_02750 [Kofleriaceae bacterium]|nr:hypothetical protein [Kofleriaceae bacterium]